MALSDLVDMALIKNPQTRASWSAAREKASEVGMARAAYYPTVNLEVGGVAHDEYKPDYPGKSKLKETAAIGGVELNYLLFDFGGRGARLSAAKAGSAAALRRYDRLVQDVVLEVQTAYYAHAAANAYLTEAEAGWKAEQWNQRSVQTAHGIGLASDNDMLAAIERIKRASYRLEKAKAEQQKSRGRLNVAVGQPANTPITVQPLDNNIPLSPLEQSVTDWMAQALANRPDLAAAFSQWSAQQAEARAAQADIWPKLYFGAFGAQGWSDSRSSDSGGPYKESDISIHDYGIGLTLRWDAFDGFYKQNKAKAANAAADQSGALAEQAKLEVSRDVWDAYQDSMAEYQNVAFWLAARARAEKDFSKSELAARTGLLSEAGLSEAEAIRAAVEASTTRALTDWLTSVARLVHASGQNPATAAAE